MSDFRFQGTEIGNDVSHSKKDRRNKVINGEVVTVLQNNTKHTCLVTEEHISVKQMTTYRYVDGCRRL